MPDDIDTSQYYVVQISEYDAMKAEIERLRQRVHHLNEELLKAQYLVRMMNDKLALVDEFMADHKDD